jgi:hypothetical protein
MSIDAAAALLGKSELIIDTLTALAEQGITVAYAMKVLAATRQTKQVQSGPLFCKIGEKGAVSVYGLNSPQFPTTLYAAQWERLADFIPSVLDFIKQWDGKEYTGQAGTNGNKHRSVSTGLRQLRYEISVAR